jgi:hypothetical protein
VDAIVPALSKPLATYMAMAEIPGGAGAATAHEALDIANREIARIRSFARPGGVYNANLRFAGTEICHTTGRRWGPPIAADGRIRAHAQWMMRFVAESGDGVLVQAPYVGAPLVLQFSKGIRQFETMEEAFVDSSEAVRGVAEDIRFPENAVFTAVKLGYERPYMPGACWRVDFIVPNTTSRGLAWIDATDGKVVLCGP